VLAQIPTTGTAGGDIAITGDGSKVYVAAGPVTVIDRGTHAVLETFSSGSTGIELSLDGSRAYVTRMVDLFGGGLEVMDTDSGRPSPSSTSACPDRSPWRPTAPVSTRRSRPRS
jgi:DNA-binding beta-propeller fold protein YncE